METSIEKCTNRTTVVSNIIQTRRHKKHAAHQPTNCDQNAQITKYLKNIWPLPSRFGLIMPHGYTECIHPGNRIGENYKQEQGDSQQEFTPRSQSAHPRAQASWSQAPASCAFNMSYFAVQLKKLTTKRTIKLLKRGNEDKSRIILDSGGRPHAHTAHPKQCKENSATTKDCHL